MINRTNMIYTLSLLLLLTGGLNWAMVGIVDLDIIAAAFGAGTLVSRVLYVLVGISAIIVAIAHMAAGARPVTGEPQASTGPSTAADRRAPPPT